MFKYAVVEIAGKQYKILPEKILLVDYLGEINTYECPKVLIKAEDDKVVLGNPYIEKEKVVFDVLSKQRQPKVRVATYHAKANTRRVVGSKKIMSQIKLQDKNKPQKREK